MENESSTTNFVDEILSKGVCMNLTHSWIICLFLCGEEDGKKCPEVSLVKTVVLKKLSHRDSEPYCQCI